MSTSRNTSHTDSTSGQVLPGASSGTQHHIDTTTANPHVLHRKFPSTGNSSSFFYTSSTRHNSNDSLRGGSDAGDLLQGSYEADGPEVEVVDFGRRLSASGGRKTASNPSTSPDPCIGLDAALWQQAASAVAGRSVALGVCSEVTPTRQHQEGGSRPNVFSAPASFDRKSHSVSVMTASATELPSPEGIASALSPQGTPPSGQAGPAKAGIQARLAAAGLPPRSPVGSPPVCGVAGNPSAPWNTREQEKQP
jgi:hypothetical protein